MRKRHAAAFAILLGVTASGVRGDDVPILRTSYVVCAAKGYICALVSPWKGLTTVMDLTERESRIIWSVPAAGAKAYFSPDARFLVFGSDTRQLLPNTGLTRSTVLLTFWSAGHSTKVHIEDLFPRVRAPLSRKSLGRTRRHYVTFRYA